MYFTKLKTIRDELNNYRPSCTYNGCTCGGVKRLQDHYHMEYIMSFLMGLSDSYSQVRGSILLMDPLPEVNRVFHLVTQEEHQRGANNTLNSNNKPKEAGANQVQTGKEEDNSTTDSHTLLPQLSSVQYQQLLNLLASQKSGSNVNEPGTSSGNSSIILSHVSMLPLRNSWIIDTGATRHICSNIKLFQSICKVPPTKLILPNNNFLMDSASKMMIGRGSAINDLYILDVAHEAPQVLSVAAETWHSRLGHLSHKRLDLLKDILNCNTSGLHKIESCYICPIAKQKKLPFNNKAKSDNAPKLAFKDLFSKHGIMHDFSCVEMPEQNPIAERKHKHLLNVAHALFFQAKMPIKFWSECILTAAYLINRTPTPLLKNKTSYELLFKKQPNYHHLRSFGCLAFASTLTAHRTKFSPRARTCVFIGYPQGVKGYKLYDLNTNQCFISRNVVFHENIFPFKKLNTDSNNMDPFTQIVLPNSMINNTPIAEYPAGSNGSFTRTSNTHEEDENNSEKHAASTAASPAESCSNNNQNIAAR
ncbi:uncharacterized protein LOC133036851 [Cannabis sativa]|uniref:uncharacterized protein LOC133036851 n=1 Tax=Cannabis sativa TaxID=3483 RepID=UPI0029CA9994|nr:uncharacterized protein LOC133036851 [Cannabis sativa]